MSSNIVLTHMDVSTASSLGSTILDSQSSNSQLSSSSSSLSSSSSAASSSSTITSMASSSSSSSSFAIPSGPTIPSYFSWDSVAVNSFQTSQQHQVTSTRARALTLVSALPTEKADRDLLIWQAIKIFKEMHPYDKLQTIREMQDSVHPTNSTMHVDYPNDVIIRFKNALTDTEQQQLHVNVYHAGFEGGLNLEPPYSISKTVQRTMGATLFLENPKSAASKKAIDSCQSHLLVE